MIAKHFYSCGKYHALVLCHLLFILPSPFFALVHDGPDIDAVLNHYELISSNHIKSRTVREAKINPHYNVKEETFTAFGKNFRLILTPRRGILAHDFQAFVADGDGNRREIILNENIAFEGHVFGEAFSKVQATYEDGRLNAKIMTAHETYYVEPSDRHMPPNYNATAGGGDATLIIYRESDIKEDFKILYPTVSGKSSRKSCGGGILFPNDDNKFNHSTNLEPSDGDGEESSQRRKRKAPPGGSSGQHIPVKNTCPLLLVADYHFFTHMGKGDKHKTISYLVALIDRVDSLYRHHIWDDDGTTGMGFEIKQILVHDEPNNHKSHYNYVYKGSEIWNVQKLLEAFSKERRNKKFCLAHLFTHQGFAGYVLGLAYIGSPRKTHVGGICTRMYKSGSRNLYLNTGLSSTLNFAGRRILTREADMVTAHELGHNWGSEHDPDTKECSPESRKGGSYIMYTYSVSGMEKNNQIFSPCSRRAMNAVLDAKSADCFQRKSESFCGNLHKEPGEECDPGQGKDRCCTSKCKLNVTAGAVCSPFNSACCSQECKFREQGFICAQEDLGDRTCFGNARCPGNSDKCGDPEPKKPKSECGERGECDADGHCLSFCETKTLQSCICPKQEDVCKWCCKASDNATCQPFTANDGVSEPLVFMPEGIPCLNGYCDKQGHCKKIKQDMVERFFSIIEKLDSSYVAKIMRDNIVGTILIFSALIWIPASCLITWVDNKQEEEERQEWDWYMNEHFVPVDLVTSKPIRKSTPRPKAAASKWGAGVAGVKPKPKSSSKSWF